VKSKVPPSPEPPSQQRALPAPAQKQENKQLPQQLPQPLPKQKQKQKSKMPDISKSNPITSSDEKHKKRSSSRSDRKGKKNSSLLNGTTDAIKKETKDTAGSTAKRAQSVGNQAKDKVEQTKGKLDETTDQAGQQVKEQAQQLGIPEQFLSTDFMQEAGFDDNDARRLMKTIMEYNQKSLKQPTDSEGEQGSEAEDIKPQEEKQIPHNDNQAEKAGDLSKSIVNNVKTEPSNNKTTVVGRSLKDLIGKKVDKSGNITDDAGNVIGKVTGDISDVDGKTVNEEGNVVDEQGKVYGKAQVVDSKEVNGVSVSTENSGQSGQISLRNGDSDLIIKVDATKSGISFTIHIPRPQ
jgi:hypothetical protein